MNDLGDLLGILERRLKLEKKCYKCGSANVVKVVPASAAGIPEIKKDIIEGRSIISCCSAGKASGSLYRCKDCNFEWDHYFELGIQQQEKDHTMTDEMKDQTMTEEMKNQTMNDEIKNQNKQQKKKWWEFSIKGKVNKIEH